MKRFPHRYLPEGPVVPFRSPDTPESGAPISQPARMEGSLPCAQCGLEITQGSLRLAVGGRHRHILTTGTGPQEYGCFSVAEGCQVQGPYDLFPGQADEGRWYMAFCMACGAELGWYYEARDGFGFYLLLLDALGLPDPADADDDACRLP